MKKLQSVYFILAFLFSCFSIFPQEGNEVLMVIGKTPVTKGEFERIYHKNNSSVQTAEQKSLQEYLDLFVNFKLKVIEAENLGLDTTVSFKTELSGYREQLAKSYLSVDEVSDQLLNEAYERTKWDIDAAHIMVKCDEYSNPADTLAAWKKINNWWNLLNKGADFAKLARDSSEDNSTKNNQGHIGYFSALQMPYAFETGAYNTPAGSFTRPIRTRFGYHIIKTLNKVPSRGALKASHIMKAYPQNGTEEQAAKAKKEIYALYDSLKMGANFGKLASKYSDDGYSARANGDLGWFSTGRMVPEFENMAYSLKNPGDYSEPFKTQYGWHIVLLTGRQSPPSFKDAKEKLKSMIKKDERGSLSRQEKLNALKKEYNFVEHPENLIPFYSLIDSSIFKGKWKKEKAANLQSILFTVDRVPFTQQNFAAYLASKQLSRPIPFYGYVNRTYKEFMENSVFEYAKSKYEEKYPDFRYLMQEYHDGILLFNLTDKMVWSKAVKDSAGLEGFYAKNRNRYMWKERLVASIYTCPNDSMAKLARNAALNRAKKDLNKEFVFQTICPKDSTHSCIKIEDGKYEKSDNAMIDKVDWKKGISDNILKDGKVIFVMKRQILKTGEKTLDEARGLVTADYQDYLEKEWIRVLRQKYPVTVNNDVMSKVK